MTLTSNQVQTVVPDVAGLEARVGNTPLLPLTHITSGLHANVQVLAKAEWFNPGGSVKDRPALNIIHNAIRRGELRNGRRLLDSTSGNMGIAYATFCASLDIPVTLVVPSNASPERIVILRALGAEIILSDPLEGSDGAILLARRMAAAEPHRYYYANQYDNPCNWEAHFWSTGPEILKQTGGALTHFIAGLGTSGTLTGVGRYLRSQGVNVRLIAVQPDSPIHGIEGLKHMPSAIRPGIYDPTIPDEILSIPSEAAYDMVRRLGREEGLFVGVSSGAAAVASLQIASGLKSGMVVTLFPDAGYKYLSNKDIWGG